MPHQPDPRLKTFWDKQHTALHAENSATWFDQLYLETRLLIGPAESVVDAGCGSGELLERLANDYPSVQGFDLSSTLVAASKERLAASGHPDVVVTEGALEEIDALVNEPVDVILCSAVIQYLHPPALTDFLQKSASKLRPGGRVVMTALLHRPMRLYYQARVFETRRESVSLVWLGVRWALHKYWRMKVALRGGDAQRHNHWYAMKEVERIGENAGFRVECCFAMSPPYGYRFHAVAHKK